MKIFQHLLAVISLISLILLTGCSSTQSSSPKLGMKYLDPYPSFAGGGLHAGLDLDVPLGSDVRAMGDGQVMSALVMDLRGIRTPTLVITYDNDRLTSHYLHIDDIKVRQGERVTKGQVVAKISLTGPSGPNTNKPVHYPHLHLEIYKEGERIDPLSINMTCPAQAGDWWFPVGCN